MRGMRSMRPLLAIAVLACAASGWSDDRVPVAELLVGRTAYVETPNATRVDFHHADGRVAWSTRGVVRSGRWWVDERGRYCRQAGEDDDVRCYVAAMAGHRLELADVEDGSVSIVSRLVPGDVDSLMAGEADTGAPCDCRLTSRRRDGFRGQ